MATFHFFSGMQCQTCGGISDAQALYVMPGMDRAAPQDVAAERRLTATPRRWVQSYERYSAFCVCATCRAPTLIEFAFRPSSPIASGVARSQFLERADIPMPLAKGSRAQVRVRADDQGVDLTEHCIITAAYPSTVAAAPSDLPDEIERLWVGDLLQVLGSPRVTLATCRTILERMCVDRGATMKGIASKIDHLVKTGVLTRDIADWVHAIRGLGNEAVHEADPVDPAVAREVYDLTKVIAEILYSYPARIARLRAGKP